MDDTNGGRMAVFETYQRALKDSFGPHFVHRVTMLIEREPAVPPEGKTVLHATGGTIGDDLPPLEPVVPDHKLWKR